MFEPLGHQKRRVFSSLGRDGSDGQVCRMIERSWLSEVTQKCTKRRPFGVTFCKFLENHDILSVMVRKSGVFLLF